MGGVNDCDDLEDAETWIEKKKMWSNPEYYCNASFKFQARNLMVFFGFPGGAQIQRTLLSGW